MICLPKRIKITKTFASTTNMSNKTFYSFGYIVEDRASSSRILLTAPITRLTYVTAREDNIKEFSEGSSIGFM